MRTLLRRMHVHQTKTVPAMVMRRNNHLSSGSGGPPSGPCQNAGARNRLRVAAAKAPIHRAGNSTFVGKVWTDESVRGDECIGLRPNGSRLSCGRSARGRKELEPPTKRLASEATEFLPTCERPPASSAC